MDRDIDKAIEHLLETLECFIGENTECENRVCDRKSPSCKYERENAIEAIRTHITRLREQLETANKRADAAVEILKTIAWVGSGAKGRIDDAIGILCGEKEAGK